MINFPLLNKLKERMIAAIMSCTEPANLSHKSINVLFLLVVPILMQCFQIFSKHSNILLQIHVKNRQENNNQKAKDANDAVERSAIIKHMQRRVYGSDFNI